MTGGHRSGHGPVGGGPPRPHRDATGAQSTGPDRSGGPRGEAGSGEPGSGEAAGASGDLAARVAAELARPPVLVRTFEDPVRGYRGFLVIDSLCGGRSGGGVRIRPGLTEGQLRDAARIMTLKQRFAGVPTGGAKSGVEGDEDLPREEKLRRIHWLAGEMAPWLDSGVLGIGPDMGTDPGLTEAVLEERGLLARRRRFPARFRGSGYYTALTAVEAAEAALRVAGGGPMRAGRGGASPLRGLRVGVEGFGAVGASAARIAAERGAQVVAVSTRGGALHRPGGLDVEALSRGPDPLAGDPAAERLPREALFDLPVDVFLPCGPGDTLDARTAASVRARVVSPGANTPADLALARVLHEAGSLFVPSFAANCGGITAATLRAAGVPDRWIERLLRVVYPRRIAALLREALAAGTTPLELALATLPPLPGEPRQLGADGVRPASDPTVARDEDGGSGGGGPRSARWLGLRRVFRGRGVPAALLAPPTWLYFAWRLGRRAELP